VTRGTFENNETQARGKVRTLHFSEKILQFCRHFFLFKGNCREEIDKVKRVG
jgi:hypothetical protein